MSEISKTAAPAPTKKLELSATQVIGGALAAMTAAALGSRLGVAGTVIGAALASVVAAVGGSLYTASIRASRDRVRTVLVRPGRPDQPEPATLVESPAPAERSRGNADSSRRRTVRTALVAAAAAFAVSAIGVTGFELATGQTLSGDDGTTVGQVSRDVSGSGGNGGSPTTGTDDRSATPSAAPSSSATEEPSATPSDTGTPSADPSASETPSASSEPTTPEPSTSADPEAAGQSSGTQ